jgi:beta-glucosidase
MKVTVTVKNTGAYAGEEIVQLYTRDLVGSVTRPVKELKGFKKIQLKPGEEQMVEFILNANDLRFYNDQMKFVAEPGNFKVFVGSSSEDLLEAEFSLKK